METEINAFKTDRDNFNTLLIDCNARIVTLEEGKQTLREKIQQLQALSQANQEQVDRLSEKLK